MVKSPTRELLRNCSEKSAANGGVLRGLNAQRLGSVDGTFNKL